MLHIPSVHPKVTFQWQNFTRIEKGFSVVGVCVCVGGGGGGGSSGSDNVLPFQNPYP